MGGAVEMPSGILTEGVQENRLPAQFFASTYFINLGIPPKASLQREVDFAKQKTEGVRRNRLQTLSSTATYFIKQALTDNPWGRKTCF
jgi:hypothetical protein